MDYPQRRFDMSPYERLNFSRCEASESSDLDIAVRGIPAEEFFTVYGEVLSRSSRQVDLIDLDLQKIFGRQILAGTNVKRIA